MSQETVEEKEKSRAKFFKQLMDEPDAVKGISVHTRYLPEKRSFSYPLYMYKFDCRYPPRLTGGYGFSRNDHFGDQSLSIDACVRKELKLRLNLDILGRIDCTCNLSILGYSFNPITPYFAHDEFDNLVALLVEVHNTPWGEKCLYAMKVAEPGSYHHRQLSVGREYSTLIPELHKKIMHVSPFHPSPTEETWYYRFLLKSNRHLTVEVYKPRVTNAIEPTKTDIVKNGYIIGKNKELFTMSEFDKKEYEKVLEAAENDTIYVPKKNTEKILHDDNRSRSVLPTSEPILCWDPEQDQIRFTATWDFTVDQTHDIITGSLRTIINVYYHAVLLFLSGKFKVYWYQPQLLPIGSYKVLSWLILCIPASWLLFNRGTCITPLPSDVGTGIGLVITAVCMSLYNFSSFSMIFFLWFAIISFAYTIYNYIHILSFMDYNIMFIALSIINVAYSFIYDNSGISTPMLLTLISMYVLHFKAIQLEECQYPGV